MSGRLVGEVLDNAPTDLRPVEYLCLIVIAEDARDTDRLARFCDTTTLAQRTHMAPGTVRNAVSELVRRGLIIPQIAGVHRGGKHQEYKVADLHNARRATIRTVNGYDRNVSPHDDMNVSPDDDTLRRKRVTPR